MTTWPTGWRETILRASGIPKTQFALDVLSAWEKSTPTDAWTANPLGMPVVKGKSVPAAFTAYAAFGTMQDFYDAIKQAFAVMPGKAVVHELISADDHAATWRNIHAMKWPGNLTESDYPHVLLDMVSTKYRDKMTTRALGTSKTTGSVNAPPITHDAIRAQNLAMHHAATAFTNTADAINYLVKGLK